MSVCAVCSSPAPHKCARCKSVSYCSPAHQKEDWASHKKVCPSLAQEALAAMFHPCDEELLLRITTCLAQNGYYKEVGVMVQLNKAFWTDEQIWDAFKDVPGAGGKTRLMYASLFGLFPRMIWLCKRGSKVNYAIAPGGYTSLMAACESGNARMIRELCNRGANVNAAQTDADGNTPLFWACQNQNRWHELNQNISSLEVIRELCARGANVNTFRRTDGMSALMWLVNSGNVELVRELCSKGANINACMKTGMNGLMFASLECNLGMVRELISWGAAVNAARTNDGANALMMASARNDGLGLEIVRFLVDRGANVNSSTTGTGTTPLMYATQNGQVAIVRLLLQRGALKSTTSVQGLTAFETIDLKKGEDMPGSIRIEHLRVKHRDALKDLLKP